MFAGIYFGQYWPEGLVVEGEPQAPVQVGGGRARRKRRFPRYIPVYVEPESEHEQVPLEVAEAIAEVLAAPGAPAQPTEIVAEALGRFDQDLERKVSAALKRRNERAVIVLLLGHSLWSN